MLSAIKEAAIGPCVNMFFGLRSVVMVSLFVNGNGELSVVNGE
jgi:hypothetical protein